MYSLALEQSNFVHIFINFHWRHFWTFNMLCIFFDLQPPHSTPDFALVEVISTCPWPCLYVFNGLRGCNMVKSIFKISTSPDRNVHRSTNVQERTGLRLREHYFVRYSDDHSNRCIGSSSILFYCPGLSFLPCCQVASQFTILFFFLLLDHNSNWNGNISL